MLSVFAFSISFFCISNPGVKTLESDLWTALCKIGAVSADNADALQKVSFMRAARTDAGVHAAGQICSMKMILEDENVIEKLNQNLPEQFRIWGKEYRQ